MELNEQHYISMQAVEDGADVYSRAIAVRLREVQKEYPGLIDITEPKMHTGDGTDQMPYFGAILTPHGIEAMNEFFGGAQ